MLGTSAFSTRMEFSVTTASQQSLQFGDAVRKTTRQLQHQCQVIAKTMIFRTGGKSSANDSFR
jgi:hypothetical protein